MKISIITDEISSDPEIAIKLASYWGIKHVEVRGLWGQRIPDIEPSQCEQLKKLTVQYGVDVAAISPGVFKCSIEDTKSVENHLKERLPRSIELAKNLGTNLVIVFGFICKTSESNRYFNQAVDALRKASDYAAKRDVVLALENEHLYLANTGERTSKLVAAVQRRNLRVNWDPCNAYASGEHPYEGYEYIKDLIVHVHLKDAVVDYKTGSLCYMPFGEGEVGLLGLIEKLKSNGYEGFLSIETHISRNRVKNTYKCWLRLQSFLEEIYEKAK